MKLLKMHQNLDGTREAYLQILERNKMDNLAYMKKKHMLE